MRFIKIFNDLNIKWVSNTNHMPEVGFLFHSGLSKDVLIDYYVLLAKVFSFRKQNFCFFDHIKFNLYAREFSQRLIEIEIFLTFLFSKVGLRICLNWNLKIFAYIKERTSQGHSPTFPRF